VEDTHEGSKKKPELRLLHRCMMDVFSHEGSKKEPELRLLHRCMQCGLQGDCCHLHRTPLRASSAYLVACTSRSASE